MDVEENGSVTMLFPDGVQVGEAAATDVEEVVAVVMEVDELLPHNGPLA